MFPILTIEDAAPELPEQLDTRDSGHQVDRYVEKARSAIYASKADRKLLTTIDAFRLAARRRPAAASFWLEALRPVTRADCQAIFDRIPPSEISETAIEFALGMLESNQKRLLTGTLAL